jgi:hypothetical protein
VVVDVSPLQGAVDEDQLGIPVHGSGQGGSGASGHNEVVATVIP